MTVHLAGLAQLNLDRGTETWCGQMVACVGDDDAVLNPAKVNCEPCLEAAADYGGQVARRLVHIRYAKLRGLAP